MSLRRPVTAVTLGFGIALTIPFLASAHNSGASATCNGITTSLQFFENAAGDRVYTSIDGVLVDTFNGPFVTTTHTVPVPQDGNTHTWQVVVDSVSGNGGVPGNGTQYDATYAGAFGPCGEVQTTTTVEPTTTTELVTTTTEQETTTSTTSSTIASSTSTTTVPASTSTAPTSTSLPSTTSSSVESTSTTSLPPTTSPPSSTPTTSVPPSPSSSSTPPPECSDNPNTPQDDCAPVCTPVTQPDGTNSCGPSLPPTGLSDWTIGLIPAAAACILCGAAIILFNRRGIQR